MCNDCNQEPVFKWIDWGDIFFYRKPYNDTNIVCIHIIRFTSNFFILFHVKNVYVRQISKIQRTIEQQLDRKGAKVFVATGRIKGFVSNFDIERCLFPVLKPTQSNEDMWYDFNWQKLGQQPAQWSTSDWTHDQMEERFPTIEVSLFIYLFWKIRICT